MEELTQGSEENDLKFENTEDTHETQPQTQTLDETLNETISQDQKENDKDDSETQQLSSSKETPMDYSVILKHVKESEENVKSHVSHLLEQQGENLKQANDVLKSQLSLNMDNSQENITQELKLEFSSVSDKFNEKADLTQQVLKTFTTDLSNQVESVKKLAESSVTSLSNLETKLVEIKQLFEESKQEQEEMLKEQGADLKKTFLVYSTHQSSKYSVVYWLLIILSILVAILIFRDVTIPNQRIEKHVFERKECKCDQMGSKNPISAVPMKKPQVNGGFVINAKISIFGYGNNYENQEELLEFLGSVAPDVKFTSNVDEKYDMNIVLKNVGIRRLEEDISFVEWKEFERKLPVAEPTLFLFVHNVDNVPADPLAFLLKEYIRKFPLSSHVTEISYDTGSNNFKSLGHDLKEHIRSIVSNLT